MTLKPGSRWVSTVCSGEFVVVRPPSGDGVLACGGEALAAHGGPRPAGPALTEPMGEGVQVGKRYTDAESGVEILCTKGGLGALTLDGRPLLRKDAKALPASD